ncbi:chitin-type 1 [Diplodia corticola]|uniref:Chitin-type 1 n=1 Tax=Diplodia corticola TaxID=236234 RepID=A0A1J9QMW1_9PEZI|nr:chitin-type 1 [Diplodia corticola]OJD29410.1 chitin-type 1 [Diplodia corticola]
MGSGWTLLTGQLLLAAVTADFTIFDNYNATDLSSSFGVDSQCMQALNATLSCDLLNTVQAAQGVDLEYWSQENVTTMCTADCSTSLEKWLSAVESDCSGQQVAHNGLVLDPKYMPLRYIGGYQLACLQDTAENWCFFESQSWVGSDYIRWDPAACYQEDETNIPAECSDPDFSTADMTSDMMAVTNLYDKELYCSECFLLMWRKRLEDPFLVSSNHTDYLLEQFDLLQTNCSTTMALTTSAPTLVSNTIATASATTTTTTSSTDQANATCTGQLVQPTDPSLPCEILTRNYNVSTGDARQVTGDYNCQFSNTTVCLPLPCELDTIYGGVTCTDLAANYSDANQNVTIPMLLQWNPKLAGSCDNLGPQALCKGCAGFHWMNGVQKPLTKPGLRRADIHQLHRYSHPQAQDSTTLQAATPALPTEPGAAAACGLYYSVKTGDTCQTIALRFGITLQDVKDLNDQLNDDCTNLWLDYAICVAPITKGATSTDGTCGPNYNNADCEDSGFGDCCSVNGYCGDGAAYCSANVCVSGACSNSTELISTDGTCNQTISCTGSGFGEYVDQALGVLEVDADRSRSCCSTSGYCGSGDDWCGPGNCMSGACDPDIGGKSLDGSCGPLFAGNKTCTGTQFGICCSTSGYCGNSTDYCARWRVSPDRPPREDVDGLDFERCAALHNAIVSYAWRSYGMPAPRERLPLPSWWEYHADEAEAVRSRLHPSIVEFLQRAYAIPRDSGISFFRYLHGLHAPSMLWFTQGFGQGDRFLTLYNTHAELGSNPDGLVYDQTDHTVHMNFSIEDMKLDEDEPEWLKLESVLSIYIDMIEHRKIVALPFSFFEDDAPAAAPNGSSQPRIDPASGARKPVVDYARPWVEAPYSKVDLEETLDIWADLIKAIETRMPGYAIDAAAAADADNQHGLVDAASLDAAGVPATGFARELLLRARRPRFVYLAPGVRLPTLDEFVAQPYRDVAFDDEGPHFVKPIRLFVVEHDVSQQPVPHDDAAGWPYNLLPGGAPCGFYLDLCWTQDPAPFEDAVLVRFPFELARRPDGSTPGVWRMDGVEKYGKPHGTQLLAVLENMYNNVTEGNWRVDEYGVAGGIAEFQEADARELEERYSIPVGPQRFW